MPKYVVLECMDCKYKDIYINETSDGKRCERCNSGMYIPVDSGSKADMKFKWFPDGELVPVGVEPKEIHRAKRLKELGKAIKRYIDTRVEIPSIWIDEYNELINKYGKRIN